MSHHEVVEGAVLALSILALGVSTWSMMMCRSAWLRIKSMNDRHDSRIAEQEAGS